MDGFVGKKSWTQQCLSFLLVQMEPNPEEVSTKTQATYQHDPCKTSLRLNIRTKS